MNKGIEGYVLPAERLDRYGNGSMKPFRLRCKVLELDGQTYMVALGLNLPPAPGEEITVTAYGMSDDKTVTLKMTADEWNSLKWHWFADEGEAERRPHAPMRPVPLGDLKDYKFD